MSTGSLKKIVLLFPSAGDLAEFLLACRVSEASTDLSRCSLTAIISSEHLHIACARFGARIDDAPDFILPAT